LKTAAQINPITYVLQAIRGLINSGWDLGLIGQALLACALMAVAMYALALVALRVRTRRS
jgi:ABC-type multidrug transport system permease subunit